MPRPASPALLLLLAGCGGAEAPVEQRVIGGDPQAGRAVIASAGCVACHEVPGIAFARGSVGPPLTEFAKRAYIAGRVPNRPGWLTLWLREPGIVDPASAMPAVGLTDSEARHAAAYLYTLR